MRSLHYFLRDVFDTDDAAFLSSVTSKYTGATGVMSVDAMLAQNTRVQSGLWFSELFKEVFGCYPCYTLLRRFLDSVGAAPFDAGVFCDFMTQAVPVVRLFAFNKPLLEKKLAFCRACDAKVLFAQKLRHRYGLGPAEYQPMLQTYRECWKHTGGTLQSLVDALSANLGAARMVVPEFTSSAVYFRFQQQAITHFGLDRFNPFDRMRLPHYVPARSSVTLFDAMSECATEASVLLKLMGANVFCGDKPWAERFPVDGALMLTRDHHRGIAYYMDAVLPYFPKVANTFVTTDGTVVPLSREPTRCFAFTRDLKPSKYGAALSTAPISDALWVNALEGKFPFGGDFDKLHWKSILACSPSVVFEEFLARYLCQHKDAISNAFAPCPGARSAVMLIDTRDNVLSVISMLVTFSNLRRDAWDAVIVCKESNRPFYERFLGGACTFVKAPAGDAFSIDNYNTMLKSAAFWSELSRFDRVLIIQDDGMLVRPGLEEASYFDRDFVGAPWDIGYPGNDVLSVATGGKLVGNGGLSLRKPRAMERVCLDHADQARTLHIDLMQQEPEDVFFARLVANPATPAEAAQFSSEELLNGSSLGFHKPWMYHSREKIEEFFDTLLSPEYQLRTAGRMGRGR